MAKRSWWRRLTTPSSHRGFFFFARGAGSHAARSPEQQGRQRILGTDDSKPVEFRHITPAEFARLSSSMQLTLLIIRRAQLSSRKAIAVTTKGKKRPTDF